jgi:hypothetical protein
LLVGFVAVAEADFDREVALRDAEAGGHRLKPRGLSWSQGYFGGLDGEVAEQGAEFENLDFERVRAVVREREVELHGGVGLGAGARADGRRAGPFAAEFGAASTRTAATTTTTTTTTTTNSNGPHAGACAETATAASRSTAFAARTTVSATRAAGTAGEVGATETHGGRKLRFEKFTGGLHRRHVDGLGAAVGPARRAGAAGGGAEGDDGGEAKRGEPTRGAKGKRARRIHDGKTCGLRVRKKLPSVYKREVGIVPMHVFNRVR